jgi:hypothetical protein
MSKQQDVNDSKRTYLEPPYPGANTIKINTHNTLPHEIMKSIVIYCLKQRNYETFTEAKWANKSGIADVFIPEIPAYLEILHSETDKSLKRKTEEYPDITQLVIRVEDHFSKEFIEELDTVYKKLKKEYLP